MMGNKVTQHKNAKSHNIFLCETSSELGDTLFNKSLKFIPIRKIRIL